MKKQKSRPSLSIPDKKEDKIFVGDFVTTNDKFTVFSETKNKQVSMPYLSGIVIDIQGKDYLIRFGNGHTWADKCGKLRDKTGKLLSADQFNVDEDFPIH